MAALRLRAAPGPLELRPLLRHAAGGTPCRPVHARSALTQKKQPNSQQPALSTLDDHGRTHRDGIVELADVAADQRDAAPGPVDALALHLVVVIRQLGTDKHLGYADEGATGGSGAAPVLPPARLTRWRPA